jgi:hypothetical protein
MQTKSGDFKANSLLYVRGSLEEGEPVSYIESKEAVVGPSRHYAGAHQSHPATG